MFRRFRIVTVAVFALGGVALTATPAAADVTCSLSGDVLEISVTGTDLNQSVNLQLGADDTTFVISSSHPLPNDERTCAGGPATVTNTASIKITDTSTGGNVNYFFFDAPYGPGIDDEPGSASDEIEIDLNLGAATTDDVSFHPTTGPVHFVMGGGGVNLNADEPDDDVDVTLSSGTIRNLQLNGTSGDDVISGNGGEGTGTASALRFATFAGSGDDVVTGSTANDTINPQTGNDTVDCASGIFDVIRYDDGTPAVLIDASGGGAIAVSPLNPADPFPNTDTLTSCERPFGSGNGDVLLSGPLDDVLLGADGNDRFVASAGADTFVAGVDPSSPGFDGYRDTVDYSAAPGAVTVDLETTSYPGPPFDYYEGSGGISGGGTQVLWNMDNVIGSQFDDTITGSATPNVFAGGQGDDTYTGGGGLDTVDYADETGPVEADLRAGMQTVTIGGVTEDTATIEQIIGTPANDRFRGNDLGNSSEFFHGRAGRDVVDYSGAARGIRVRLFDQVATDDGSPGVPATDFLFSIEDVIGTDFRDVIRGSNKANTIRGRGGADDLFGRRSGDRLYGGAGADDLGGGRGTDGCLGGGGADEFRSCERRQQ